MKAVIDVINTSSISGRVLTETTVGSTNDRKRALA
jgi:hypothetical protein